LEFGPPAILGALWAGWNYNGTAASAITNFSAAFVSLGIVWANFLRIQYQQTTRVAQEEASNQIETVLSALDRVEGSLQRLAQVVTVQTNLSPEQSREVGSAVNEAHNAIATANNVVKAIGASVGRSIVRGALGGLLRHDTRHPPPHK
jgi:hypothetical protein